jgi:hypothetical protein
VRPPSGAVTAKNQSNDFPEYYLHFGRSKVIILGAARHGETLDFENGSDTIYRESLPEVGAA